MQRTIPIEVYVVYGIPDEFQGFGEWSERESFNGYGNTMEELTTSLREGLDIFNPGNVSVNFIFKITDVTNL